MACHVLRLEKKAECSACGRSVPPGRMVITDQIEPPVFVPVCKDCTDDLDGAEQAIRLLR